jgi:hypothetical protein
LAAAPCVVSLQDGTGATITLLEEKVLLLKLLLLQVLSEQGALLLRSHIVAVADLVKVLGRNSGLALRAIGKRVVVGVALALSVFVAGLLLGH